MPNCLGINISMNYLTQIAYTVNGENKTQITSWLNHSSLHFWMQRLATEKKQKDDFDHVEVEISLEDIGRLLADIEAGELTKPWKTGWMFGVGFSMGVPKDERYREQDIDFCYEAKFRLFGGVRIFYVGIVN